MNGDTGAPLHVRREETLTPEGQPQCSPGSKGTFIQRILQVVKNNRVVIRVSRSMEMGLIRV